MQTEVISKILSITTMKPDGAVQVLIKRREKEKFNVSLTVLGVYIKELIVEKLEEKSTRFTHTHVCL